MLLDASFSPIRRVAYNVDNARVEQRTDLDKLIFEIETNGTVEPQDSIRQAAELIQDQLAVFAGRRAQAPGGAAEPPEPLSSIRYCCGQSTTWSSRFDRPIV